MQVNPKILAAFLLTGLLLCAAVANTFVGAVDWLLVVTVLIMGWLAVALLAWSVVATQSDLRHRLNASASLFESVNSPRFIVQIDGPVIYANTAGADWLGGALPFDRLSALAAREYDGDEIVERLRQAADAGIADQVEIPLRGDMPEPDWFQVNIRSVDALPGHLIWSLEDITARKTINDVLGSERQDLSDFLDFMPAGVYSVDVDGSFHYVNQRFAQWLGYTAESLVEMSLSDVVTGPVTPQLDGEWHGHVSFKSATGDPFNALVFQSAFDDAGETRTRTLVVRDAKKDNPVQGGIVGAHFRVLFDSAPVAIATIDLDGALTDCNPAFASLVGQNRDSLSGEYFHDFLNVDDKRAFQEEVARLSEGKSDGVQVDARLTGPEMWRDQVQASIYLGPMAGPAAAAVGEVEGIVVHLIDTTEQKSLEVQFAQAQKMQAMGQLAGGVAHDFNNLLTAMIGFCDLLLQRHTAGDPSFADIMQIKQNANRAANLVRQLLAFSRKQPLQPKELNCTNHLTELSHLLTRLIGESIEFELQHGRDLGVVRVDPGQFDQIIINLAVNARDAMPGGGTLKIKTDTEIFDQPTQIGAEQVPAGRYVTIKVSDTGKGIEREDIGRIFEPFFSTKQETPGAGTGLGLATVYGIVRQTGGFILVESAPGQGAQFTIYLPRLSPSEDAAAKSTSADGIETSVSMPGEEDPVALAGKIGVAMARSPAKDDLSGSGTILLVEDEDAVRVFAARALKNKGYNVLEARTGEQAMDILHDGEQIDLLITDMMMPGMDGGTLSRFVKVERPDARIILISGYSEEVARGDVVDSPDIHFLPKPFSLGQLASKVKEVLALPMAGNP